MRVKNINKYFQFYDTTDKMIGTTIESFLLIYENIGGKSLAGFVIVLPIILLMTGLYFITIGFWELKEGTDKRQYIKYMFTGLCLIFIFCPMIWFFGNGFIGMIG